MEIPLFLLNAVLHSGGRLSLRVFEARYMDMVKDCLRTQTSFGVCLLEQGDEVLAPSVPSRAKLVPQRVGTLATIADWDMPQLGILNIVVHGGARFRLVEHHEMKNGLVRAAVELLPEPPVTPIPGDYARLIPMLRALLEGLEEVKPPAPHRFYDAAWVADRWAELLPLPLATHQQLLELDDGAARLDAIYRFLERS
ncbi:MAG: LON peptidase substrate-binding domain-containing protein [Rhodocyclaceae bacterium]|nr:LON peptidase substrate-binding domain-containing protein [Rhodocyclaceae bacterium]